MFLKIHFVGPIFILGGGFRFLNESVLSSFNQRNGKACPHQSASAGWVPTYLYLTYQWINGEMLMEEVVNGGGPLDDDAAIDDGMMDGIESHQMNVWVGVLCRYVCT